MKEIILEQDIIHDEFTEYANVMYDVQKQDKTVTVIQDNIEYPDEWNIGLIYGESGSGKSTILKNIGEIFTPQWDDHKSIISDLNASSPFEAAQALCCTGLSTIPAWLRSYKHLSTGQKFRADLAKNILHDQDVILIDEFTSVVDRNVAKSASFALSKYIRKKNKKIIVASCHSDIIEWLQPDWIYNPTEAKTHVFQRGSLRRPEIKLEIYRGRYQAWNKFKHHHYLTDSLHTGAKIFLFYWNKNLVAINCVLPFPHAKIKKAWRESRLVVLPDYQGMGIGVIASNYIGSLVRSRGGRYYSRTTHPAMIYYRNNNKHLWRFSSKDKSSPASASKSVTGFNNIHTHRYAYSFEYIGPASSLEEGNLFYIKGKELDL